jgi:hypothetical protein
MPALGLPAEIISAVIRYEEFESAHSGHSLECKRLARLIRYERDV